MIKKKKTFLPVLLIVIVVAAVAAFSFFFIGKGKVSQNITWGVDFSQSHAEYLGLNWKKTYSAVIDDLGVKHIKLHTNWNWVEGKKDIYYFTDIDWQIKQAEQNNVKIIYVVGLKTGRWPECHVPGWLGRLSEDKQKAELLEYIKKVVERYKTSEAVINWQVENEPLFRFGECPYWYYDNGELLKEEVALVKSLDPSRKVIISDSGEQSTWFEAAKIGDILGVTMYRNAWASVTDTFGFDLNYSFLNPITYTRKAAIIKGLFSKEVICIELQAEPWTQKPIIEAPLEEQLKSMNADMFKENVQFAKQTGFDKVYLWGAEWWYWMKTKQNHPEIWDEARKLFQNK